MSVTASDDVDVSSSTDPSVNEQDQNIEDKPVTSPKIPSPNASKGPVQLLRRQQLHQQQQQQQQQSPSNSSRQQSPSMTMTGDTTSPPRNDIHTPVKETVDPSLLEAFANPMNRQYLLQLEGSLNNFVSQSRLAFLVYRG